MGPGSVRRCYWNTNQINTIFPKIFSQTTTSMNSGVPVTSMIAGVESLVWRSLTDLHRVLTSTFFKHLWDELEQRLRFWLSHPAMNTLLHRVENVYRIVQAATAGNSGSVNKLDLVD
ncbi:hypothetical protein XENOCAPTIV_004716 [Xenoophorus captivus]|uniref:Uncharacterized protein n=1 Tax=Xenoophorus captivus TaxID=1517983 RepID=A0ABV0Q828_9TELE